MSTPISPRLRSRRATASAGITMLEVLVAVVISSSAITFLVPALLRQVGVSAEADRLTKVEAVVSRDLDYISDYARYWKLSSGPYNLSNTITNTSTSYVMAPQVEYAPPADRCANGTLAAGFLDDLASVTTTPARPYAIPVAGGAQSLPVDTDLEVSRTISSQGSRIHVSYSLTGSKAEGLRFFRQASVLIEAAAWCDTLP
jgi:type II secretory pathway pseudopilin PulG